MYIYIYIYRERERERMEYQNIINWLQYHDAEIKSLSLQGCFILVKGIITVVGQGSDAAAIASDWNNKQVIFKECQPFTDFINK